MLCPKCQAEIEDGAAVCSVCGEQMKPNGIILNNGVGESDKSTVIEIVDERKPKSFKRPLNFLSGLTRRTKATAAAVAVVIVVTALLMVLTHTRTDYYLVYQKGNQLLYTAGSHYTKPGVISNHINTEYSDDVVIDEKTGKAFYPYDDAEQGEGYILYKGDKGDYDRSGDQIAVDVANFQTVLSNNAVYYLTYNGALYLSDMKSSYKIHSSVSRYYTSETTGDVVWQTKDNSVYYKPYGADAQLVAKQVNILFVSDGATEMVYAGDKGVLYSRKIGSDPVIVGVGVSDVRIFSADSMYYLIKSDLTSDDVGSSSLFNLYYYNGEQSVLLTEHSKVIDSGLDKEVMFSRTGSSSEDYCLNIIIKDKVIPINLVYSQIIDAVVDYSSDRFYYIIGTQSENTLCYADIDTENATLKEAVKVDENVDVINRVNYAFSSLSGNQCYYLKNTNDKGFGDLYIDGSKVAENVNTDTVIYGFGENKYVFCSDIYEDSGIGTLVAVEHNSIKVLGENVTEYEIIGGTDIAFISRAEHTDKVGTLQVYKEGGLYTVDEGVSSICYYTKADTNSETDQPS